MSWRDDEGLPPEVRQTLGAFVDAAQGALGADLEALLLYGALARGDEFYPKTSPVELLVVLRDVAAAVLDRLAPVVRAANRRLRVTTMIVTRADLERSTDVFPTKFCAMQAHHVLLCGTDPLAGCEVSPEHLRLRCEQELRNVQLRLRAGYLRAAGREADLRALLADFGPRFVDLLQDLLRVRTGDAPALRVDVVQAVEAALGLEQAALEEVLAIQRGGYAPGGDDLRRLVDRFFQVTDRAAGLADTHAAAP